MSNKEHCLSFLAILAAGALSCASLGDVIPSVVLKYDGTYVRVEPYSEEGVRFTANAEIGIGCYEGMGFITLVDPVGKGGGRMINIPNYGAGVQVTEEGGNVTVSYPNGSSATVPGVYVPPSNIQLPDGAGQAGTVEGVPEDLDEEELDLWLDLLGQEEWFNDLFEPGWQFDPLPISLPVGATGIGFDEVISSYPVEFEPEPSTLALLAVAGALLVRRGRARG